MVGIDSADNLQRLFFLNRAAKSHTFGHFRKTFFHNDPSSIALFSAHKRYIGTMTSIIDLGHTAHPDSSRAFHASIAPPTGPYGSSERKESRPGSITHCRKVQLS